MKKTIPVVQKILNANDEIAQQNQEILDQLGILAINIMASPGSGKTSLILRTIKELSGSINIGVIEGDTAPVTIDSDKISKLKIPVTQINTGGKCHLDAMMVKTGMDALDLTVLELLIIENVGNLVCPAAFRLGEHKNVVVASIPEGDDKPYKYPGAYRGVEVLIISKIDLLPYVPFDMEYFRKGVEILNPGLITFVLSAKSGEGMDRWADWLCDKVTNWKESRMYLLR